MLLPTRVSSFWSCLRTVLSRIGLARGGEAATQLLLNQGRIFEQADDLLPYDPIEEVLANRAVVAP